MRFEPKTTWFRNQHPTIQPSWQNDWVMLWILICMAHLTVCFYHVTYAFQSESLLYSYLNVKEILAQNKRNIRSLSDNNGIWTHNHLVRERTLNHLPKQAKLLSCVVSTYLHGAVDCMLLSCHARVSEWIHTFIVAWMSRSSFLKTGAISEV